MHGEEMNIFIEKRIKGNRFSFSGNIFDHNHRISQKIFIIKNFYLDFLNFKFNN